MAIADASTSIDPHQVAAALGRRSEDVESIVPYALPEVYWIRIGTGPDAIGGPFIVRDGEPIVFTGYPIASAWLRRAILPLARAPEISAVAQILFHYQALPLGWSDLAACGEDPISGARASLRLHPFALQLVTLDEIEGRSRLLGAPPGPPSGMRPPGGYAPPRASRAILEEVNGRLTWIVTRNDGIEGTDGWRTLLRERIE